MSTTIAQPPEHSVAQTLAAKLHALGARQVSTRGAETLLEFDESDFSIRPCIDRTGAPHQLRFHAAVRAPEPDLATWWSEWNIACDASNIVEACIQEIRVQRVRFQRMLRDHGISGA